MMNNKKALILLGGFLVLGAAIFFYLVHSRPQRIREPLNLLLISLDTTRADRLGCYGDSAAQTPALDALAAGGLLFENCYAPAPLTLPAHCSIFTGRWPIAHGVRNNSSYALAAAETTLAEILTEAGYDSGALIAAYVLKSKFGLAQGFDRYDDRLGFEEKAGNLDAQITADRVYAKFQEWLQRRSAKPFFLWTHFYDPHKPYAPPAEYLRASANDAYRGEVAYMDYYIGRMIADLKERRLFERTLIVIVGDHGEAFGEHGEKGHGIFCYEESLKVPLIIVNPGRPHKPQRVATRVSLVDVMPTVLDLLAVKGPEQGLQGNVLTAAMAADQNKKPRPLYLESLYGLEMNNWAPLTGLISGSFKYISLPQAELYDLQSDPGEKTNLFFKKNLLARQLDRGLAAFIVAHQSRRETVPALAMKTEDKTKLAALGYISSFAATGQSGMDPKTGFAYQLRYEELVAALNRGEVARVEAEALGLRDETTALKLPFAYVLLHYVYERRQQWDKLEANLRGAGAVFKDSPTQALTFRGNLLEFYLANERFDLAEPLALEMFRIYPDKTRVLEVLGTICEKKGDWAGALKWYRQAKAIEPGNSTLAKKAIKMLVKTGDRQTAFSESERLLQTTDAAADTDLLFTTAMLAVETGNNARSETLMKRLTEIQPTAERWFDYALILGRNNKYDAAIAGMEKALAMATADFGDERRQAAAKALQVWKERRR